MTVQEIYHLEASLNGDKLSLCFYEHSMSLKNKIDVDVKLDKINELSVEIIRIIHSSQLTSPSSSQLQGDLKRHCVCLFDELLPVQIRSKIKNISGGNIIFSIDESLVFIPWELLNDGNDYLCLKFSVGRTVRTSRLMREVASRLVGVPPNMLVLADPCGDLKGAQKEAKVIRNELDKNGHVNVSSKTVNITIDYVKQHIRDYDILHYAGHADHGQSNATSGLRLSDGCFSVNDILNLGVTAPLPALIFCNACQSAHENSADISRGVFGIANAFLNSGVKHYIGCLWKISDVESVTAAEIFYRSIFAGETIGESLRLTRHELIKQYGMSSLVWTSYVLYGDPSVMFGITIQSLPSLIHRQNKTKNIVLIGLAAGLLAGVSGFVIYHFNRQISTPTILINDFVVPSTQQKDLSLTYDVLNEFKKISSANLVDTQKSSGFDLGKAGVQRVVSVQADKKENVIHLIIKVSEPDSDKIITLKEFTVKENDDSSKTIAERILDLIKTGLSTTDQIELTRLPDEDPQAHRLLAQSYDLFLKGDFKGALQLCEKIKKIDPENRNLYKRLGNVYDRLGDRDKALSAYFKYAELCKKSNDLRNLFNAYINIGGMIQMMGDEDLAYKYFQTALQGALVSGFSYETAKAYTLMGSWYVKKKDFVKAKELFLKSIAINKENLPDENHLYYLAANYNELGVTFENEQNYSEALKYLNMSLDLFKQIGAQKVIAEVKERINRVFDKHQVSDKF